MDIYVLLVDHSGVFDFYGITSNYEKALELKNKHQGSHIRTEDVSEDKAINNEFFIGSYYESSVDLHSYMGVFYSYQEAKQKCGDRSLVLNYNLHSIG